MWFPLKNGNRPLGKLSMDSLNLSIEENGYCFELERKELYTLAICVVSRCQGRLLEFYSD